MGLRALVVEDESLTRMIVADALRDAGFDVVEAEDAHGALEILRTLPGVELLCTDVQMPGDLDGIDLALRARWLYPDMEVIIASSITDDPRCIGIPFLAKPFAPRQLVELACRGLGRPWREGTVRAAEMAL